MTKQGKRAKRLIASLAVTAALALCAPAVALADDALGDADTPAVSAKPQATPSGSDAQSAGDVDTSAVQVSKDGDAAALEGSSFAISDFSRAQKGSNRSIDGEYRGYAYLIGQGVGQAAQLIAVNDQVVAYIPRGVADQLSLDLEDAQTQTQLKQLFCALDAGQSSGSVPLSGISVWHFTTQPTYDLGAVRLMFDQEISGKAYVLAIGVDGSDITDSENANYAKPSFADFGVIVPADQVSIVAKATGLAAAGEFLQNLDWSPLWVSLRTTGIAIVFIVILGLLAAYFCLNLSSRAKSIFDAIFTIPMVLPPTVCGFILLFICGSNTAFGRFWIETGFPLIFSPTACVIAAVVVAFPLMYRNALGAFESLDRNMLDAARTLGWSNAKIFVRLMLPLSWSSIAAGMVLAFARALGEFGATLFMAGNYVGITRTIPIAIYFEWMNGNSDVAWFWTGVIIVFSLVVIVFINLWSGHTTKYRKRSE
ncbi:molybdate ABC transporter permease subunit [uncultured Senegalimassilia sp.]|mgnify:FL=1|uniref:molybdate ABC transporter permease subunit n=1 Tax=uncultured Senegalimassilia sp. TaxID=1714350 RepID=UPI0026211FBD|nr:molybdate ABC transporter permease subunit [uncultured Senegalimassilia sp.]